MGTHPHPTVARELTFNIGSGLQTITLTSRLPEISHPVVSSSNNVIGGTAPNTRNVIAAVDSAISVTDFGGNGNQILGTTSGSMHFQNSQLRPQPLATKSTEGRKAFVLFVSAGLKWSKEKDHDQAC